jgi:hypothetical protein
MKKAFMIIFFVALLSLSGFSQDKNEKSVFNGNWFFSQKDSDKLFTADSSGLSELICSIKKVVHHTEPELKIKTVSECYPELSKSKLITSETDDFYYTDGRGEINKASNGTTIWSQAKWDKNKLLLFEYAVNPQNQKKQLLLITELSVSKNKEKLIERTSTSEANLYSSLNMFGLKPTKKVFKISK